MPLALTARDVVRFAAQLVPAGGHLVWMGAVGSDGYGRLRIAGADGGVRVVTPHQVAATIAFGRIPAGATVMHDCDLRLCCQTAPGHVRIATQRENVAQAVARGRMAGPRPGLVDVRGPAGQSRAIQAALRPLVAAQRGVLGVALAAEVAAGDPRAGLVPLFDLPAAGQSGGLVRPMVA